jgi:hypothetical protein
MRLLREGISVKPGRSRVSTSRSGAGAVVAMYLWHLPEEPPLTDDVRARIDRVIDEGFEIFDQFDRTVREKAFHPFVAADYCQVLDALVELRHTVVATHGVGPPAFLELGSATGVITIIADLLGFDAVGIELDASLVAIARRLAERHQSRARFVAGSFLPAGYRWKSPDGDERTGTIGSGRSAYLELGRALDDFDVVYVYPWEGEKPVVLGMMERYGDPAARLLVMDAVEGLRVVDPAVR